MDLNSCELGGGGLIQAGMAAFDPVGPERRSTRSLALRQKRIDR